MKILYLMRHGQTLFNQLHKIQGFCDSPLTDLGIDQALQAGKYFSEQQIQFTAGFASTQERASDTLELVWPNHPYERLKGLKEWNFGLYEGAPEYLNPPHKPGEESYGDQFLAYGGESVDQVAQRMTETLTTIMAENTDYILVVTHGGAAYAFYLKWRKARDRRPSFSNCCILKYAYLEGKFSLLDSIDPGK